MWPRSTRRTRDELGAHGRGVERVASEQAAREVLGFAQQFFGAEGEGLGLYESSPDRSIEMLVYLWSQDALREVLLPDKVRLI